jgi:hypothetical protein
MGRMPVPLQNETLPLPAAWGGAVGWITSVADDIFLKMKVAVGFQIAALVLAGLAVIWGVFCAYSVAFPGPSGEWAGVGVLAAWLVNVPIGLLTLAIGLIVRKGSPRLRRILIITSLIALSLPIMASLIWRHWH